MSKMNPCPQDAEALEIIESMLDVADMRNKGPIYADDPPRSGLCRIPEEDAAILRQYIADRRAQPTNSRFADCHIWEPGDNLNTISDKCDVLIKAEDIKAIIAQPANEPLTLEQLREMDGEPVWCEDTTNYSGIIKLAEDWGTEKMEAHIWTFDEEGNPKCHNVRLMMEFGAKIYRCPPERNENDG